MILYGLLGIIILRVFKVPVRLSTIAGFVALGGASGFTTLVVYGFLVADENGQLNSAVEVIPMFVISGIVAILVGVIFAKVIAKYSTKFEKDVLTHSPQPKR